MKKELMFILSFFAFFYFSLNAFGEDSSKNIVQQTESEDAFVQDKNISEKSEKIEFPSVELL